MLRTTTGTSITGHGVWHPDTILDNDELCVAFNEFVRRENAKYATEIAAGTRQPLKESSSEFILKAPTAVARDVRNWLPPLIGILTSIPRNSIAMA